MRICKLFKQGERNSQCVPTTLGGGQIGYLTLYVKPVTSNTIQDTIAFVRSIDPGIFSSTLPPEIRAAPLTPAEMVTQKLTHDEEKREYNEV